MAWIECKMGNTDAIVKNVSWYGTCATAQGTQAKVATTSNSKFTLVTGAKVTIKFTYGNTASNPTLNVDSKGAKYIKAYGTTAPSVWWNAGDVVTFTYDGTSWIMGASGGQISQLNNSISQKKILPDYANVVALGTIQSGNAIYTAPSNGILYLCCVADNDQPTVIFNRYYFTIKVNNVIVAACAISSFYTDSGIECIPMTLNSGDIVTKDGTAFTTLCYCFGYFVPFN